MATSLYAEQEADFRFKGDYVDIDGTLNVDGATTLAGVTASGVITGAGRLVLSSPAVTAAMTLTVGTAMTTHTGITVAAPSGTDAGLAWTSGAPAFSNGQKYIVLTAGSTAYRIPVWLNA